MYACIIIVLFWINTVFCRQEVPINSPNVVSCAQQCANSLRTSVIAVIGGEGTQYSSLLAPFHHILSHSDNVRQAARKSEYTCSGVLRFEGCLKRCPTSQETETWRSAISHWVVFCSFMKDSNKAVQEYMHCEHDHMHRTRHACGYLNVSPQSSFTYFCRKFEKYRRCYSRVHHNCSAAATHVRKQIEDAVANTYEKLLKMSSNRIRIPNKCTSWPHSLPGEDDETEGSSEEESPSENEISKKVEAERQNYHRSASTPSTARIPILRAIPTDSVPVTPTSMDLLVPSTTLSTSTIHSTTVHYHPYRNNPQSLLNSISPPKHILSCIFVLFVIRI